MKTIEFFFQKFLILLLFFLITFIVFSQTTTLKKISGKVTSFGKPLKNVNIIILGKKGGNTTNEQGLYSINAWIGDKIQFSYIGYKKVILVVEDITKVLNINMDAYVNELDEVELTVNNKVGKVEDMHEIMDIDIKTSLGTINPLKTAGPVHYLDNTSLRHIASPSLEDALSGRFSKVEKRGDKLFIRGAPAKYDVDGLLYEIPPALSFSTIEHLFIIKGKALIIIRTKDAATFWIDKGLQMSSYTDGYAGFKQWFGNPDSWKPKASLLEGIAGIGLSMIDYLSEEQNSWDKCLLIQ